MTHERRTALADGVTTRIPGIRQRPRASCKAAMRSQGRNGNRMPREALHRFSRRTLLGRTAALGVGAGAASAMGPAGVLAAAPTTGQNAAPTGTGNESTPLALDAAAELLGAFDRVPVVALGEAHGLQEEHDFLGTLLRHPDFPARVNDIVVEFGNALYQDVVDRYLAGEAVDRSELRQAWRNTTQSPLQQWDSPV